EAALNPPAPHLSAGWVFALVAALSALGLGLHWSLRFPASNAIDTAYQWDQVHGLLPYTDLHTPGHTVLLKALYALWDSPASAVGAHIAALATLQGCFAVYLYRRGAHLGWLLALSALFTACSDPTKWYFYPGKDIPYTACLAGITYLLMRSREPGFRFGWWRAAGLGALLAFSVLFRYNGIVPVALCGLYFAVYFMRRRQAGRLVALALAAGICALSVNAYAYRALNMARVKNGFAVQTFGAGIAAVVAQEGEMTPQQLARIGNALPISWMREHYKPWATKQLVWKREPSVESHPIDQGCNNCFVLAMGDRPAEVVGIYLSLLPRNAGLLLKELARNTTVVWSARNAGGAFSIPLLTLTLAIIACAAWSRRTARRHIVVFLPVAANLLSIAASTVTNEYRYLLPTFTLFWPLAIYIVLIGRNETAAGAPNVIG
ncbi:MAG: hypothetical protein GX558_09990, partial [Clostridiales bacterium]|nr:hypothetical protein [Clostridiales bacterium]